MVVAQSFCVVRVIFMDGLNDWSWAMNKQEGWGLDPKRVRVSAQSLGRVDICTQSRVVGLLIELSGNALPTDRVGVAAWLARNGTTGEAP